MKSKKIHIHQVEIHLLPEKAVFLPEFNTLCIADWHLGKAAHFRKSGIPLPQPDLSAEFETISQLIKRFETCRVVLLGDVFHSSTNNDWIHFEQFITSHPQVEWIITKGNHDIVKAEKFASLDIQVIHEFRISEKISCTHHPIENLPSDQLNIAGHVHPGCEIITPARQKFRLPCFHYSQSVLTLPAFGGLTGLYIFKADEDNKLFAIIGDEIREITGSQKRPFLGGATI